jgi:hypothetical protein
MRTHILDSNLDPSVGKEMGPRSQFIEFQDLDLKKPQHQIFSNIATAISLIRFSGSELKIESGSPVPDPRRRD